VHNLVDQGYDLFTGFFENDAHGILRTTVYLGA
jgi:hypothetical protein